MQRRKTRGKRRQDRRAMPILLKGKRGRKKGGLAAEALVEKATSRNKETSR